MLRSRSKWQWSIVYWALINPGKLGNWLTGIDTYFSTSNFELSRPNDWNVNGLFSIPRQRTDHLKRIIYFFSSQCHISYNKRHLHNQDKERIDYFVYPPRGSRQVNAANIWCPSFEIYLLSHEKPTHQSQSETYIPVYIKRLFILLNEL